MTAMDSGLSARVAQLEDGRKLQGRLLWLVGPALVGALATGVIYAAAAAERVGETAAELRSITD